MRTSLLLAASLFLGLLATVARAADEPRWIRVSSPHFSILTDATDKKGNQAILRLEQVRSEIGSLLLRSRLHLSQPIDVIAVKNDDEYIRLAPVRNGRPIATTGFLLLGDDRYYVVLNLADDRSWQTVTDDLFRLYMNDNYPPTPPWFDTGLISYFSTLQLTDQQGEIGGDPGSYLQALSSEPWMPIPELFAVRVTDHQKIRRQIFAAESWIIVHYLLHQNKLPETGAYFDWSQNQGLTPEQATEKAYGVSAAQFDQAVKQYFRELTAGVPAATPGSKLPPPPRGAFRFTPGVGTLDIGTSTKQVPIFEARALIAEMMVRLPEHRDAAMQELDDLLAQPKGDSAIIHRAKAWALFQQKKTDDAVEELKAAVELSDEDAWTHYYMARWKYRSALDAGHEFPGLANMLIDLRIVIDWYPDFAEAHNMLAMGRVEGGGVGSAVNAIRLAVELSPRNETYQLNMGLVNMAAKKWDVAAAVLERLKASHNPEIAKDAGIYLDELPNSKKYGIVPKRIGVKDTPKVRQTPFAVEEEDPDEIRQRQRSQAAVLDTRKTQFLKGKLLRVDCSQPPVAVLTVLASRTLRLRTEDYHTLLLVGSDQFSCDWKNVPVTVNYKSGGKSDGDLVSLEIQD